MNITIPFDRSNLLHLARVFWSVLIHGKAALEMKCEEKNFSVNGEEPVLLSKAEVHEFKLRHAEVSARAALMQEAIEEAAEALAAVENPMVQHAVRELQDAKASIAERRVIH